MAKFKKGDVTIITKDSSRGYYKRGMIITIDEDNSLTPYIIPHFNNGNKCVHETRLELLSSIPLKDICVHTPTKKQWDEVYDAINSTFNKDRWGADDYGIWLCTHLYTSSCKKERQIDTDFVISFEDWETYLKPNIVTKKVIFSDELGNPVYYKEPVWVVRRCINDFYYKDTYGYKSNPNDFGLYAYFINKSDADAFIKKYKPVEEDIHKGLIVGEKYVPLKKSIGESFYECIEWHSCKERGYLYYKGVGGSGKHIFSKNNRNDLAGSFYAPDDVILYSTWLEQQKPIDNSTPINPPVEHKFKVGDKVRLISDGSSVHASLTDTGTVHIGAKQGDIVTIKGIIYKNGAATEQDPRYYGDNFNVRGEDLELVIDDTKSKVLTNDEKFMHYIKDNDLELVPYTQCSECFAYNNGACKYKGFDCDDSAMMRGNMLVKKSTVQEVKVGDIVVVTEQYNINVAIPGHIAKLAKKDNSNIPYCVDSCDYEYVWCCGVRKATQEEINAYNAGYLTLKDYHEKHIVTEKVVSNTPVINYFYKDLAVHITTDEQFKIINKIANLFCDDYSTEIRKGDFVVFPNDRSKSDIKFAKKHNYHIVSFEDWYNNTQTSNTLQGGEEFSKIAEAKLLVNNPSDKPGLNSEEFQIEMKEIYWISNAPVQFHSSTQDELEITIFEKPIKEKRKLIQVSI